MTTLHPEKRIYAASGQAMTEAAIDTGVLGDRYISLQPGGDDRFLNSGDRISFTESAVSLERLIGQLVYGTTRGERKDAPASRSTTGPGIDQ